MNTWLKRDALNRMWRTILQTLALVVLAPAADAAYQVFQLAVVDAAAGQSFDWGRVGDTALKAAIMGASLSILAFVHRLKLDPSAIPSAQPPTPPRASGGPVPGGRIYNA